MNMKVSLKGSLEIAEHEGIVPAPYLDSVGVWTIGIGHTKAAGGVNPEMMDKGMPANLNAAVDEAIELFAVDLKSYEERVNEAVKVPLQQHEFDALVSFDFNTGGIFRANLTKHLNAGNRTKAAQAFMGWLRPPEIRKRRTAEMNLFITGDYDGNGDSVPVWKVNENGKLLGIERSMHGKELLKRMKKTGSIEDVPIKVTTAGTGIAIAIAAALSGLALLRDKAGPLFKGWNL